MKVVVIRHADDESGTCRKKHDCPVNSRGGQALARKVGSDLLSRLGPPNEIYVSPFRRTMETLEFMLEGQNKENIVIKKDNRLCRYFSQKEKRHPHVHSETLKHNIPIQESFYEFESRVRHFGKEIKKIDVQNKVIWVITHALVYKRLAKQFHVRKNGFIPFMDYFVLSGNLCHKCNFYHI